MLYKYRSISNTRNPLGSAGVIELVVGGCAKHAVEVRKRRQRDLRSMVKGLHHGFWKVACRFYAEGIGLRRESNSCNLCV